MATTLGNRSRSPVPWAFTDDVAHKRDSGKSNHVAGRQTGGWAEYEGTPNSTDRPTQQPGGNDCKNVEKRFHTLSDKVGTTRSPMRNKQTAPTQAQRGNRLQQNERHGKEVCVSERPPFTPREHTVCFFSGFGRSPPCNRTPSNKMRLKLY